MTAPDTTELDEFTRYRLLFATLAHYIGPRNFEELRRNSLAAFARQPAAARAAITHALGDPGLVWATWESPGYVELRGAFDEHTLVVLTLARFQRARLGRVGKVVTWELRP